MIQEKLMQGIAAFLGVLLILALLFNGYQALKIAGLKVEVAQKDVQIADLKAGVKVQNAAVETLRKQGEEAFARFDEAMVNAGKMEQKLAPVVAFVKTAKGTSCKDAMPVVERALASGGVR